MAVMLGACSSGAAPPTPDLPDTTIAPSTTISTVPITSTMPVTATSAMPATTTTSPGSLAGQVVVLDPGHNGMNWAYPDEINREVDIGTGTKACNTTGTSTNDGYQEAQFTWEVALLAKARLEQLGATVVLTREDNEGWGPCITERAAIGNRAGAAAVISIHADGGPSDGRGFHIIYPKEVPGLTDDIADESLRLARALHAAYAAEGMPVADYIGRDGYSERDDLGGLTLSDVPVVFLEAGNMRHPIDAELLKNAAFQARIADAITEALIAFLTG